MHINFETKRNVFEMILLKGLEVNRLLMVFFVIGVIMLMVLFGLVQKFRLDYLGAKRIKMEHQVIELRKGTPLENLSIASSAGKDQIFINYEEKIIWSDILKELSVYCPENVQVTQFKSTSSGRTVNIGGDAPDQASVADFVKALQGSGTFKDVKLLSSTSVQAEGGSTRIVYSIASTI
ncbi:MAG: PilN domain-containing protein [Deltaproteobacteria bacterium]|nr:PilN domain-containing protein [Deltaproteobacteria bacterium]MBI2341508.1 PilN domain-containing protein [Deltaproteobacteria bacterium]